MLAVGGLEFVQVWNWESGAILKQVHGPDMMTMSFSHDSSAIGGYLATVGNEDTPTQIFRVRDWKRVKVLEAPSTPGTLLHATMGESAGVPK